MKSARWSIVLLMLAMFFGTMEMSVVITALPTMGRTFPQAVNWLPWLITASLMAAAVAMPLGGKMADEWGVKKTFLLGLIFFSLGSLLAGLVGSVFPDNIGLLIGFRFLQGFGGGTFAPVGLKLVSIVLKGARRTQTIGLAGMLSPLATVLGPNIGGILVDHFPWQVIFLANAAIGLVVTLLAVAFTGKTPAADQRVALDIPGIGVLSGAILSAMLALTLIRQAGFAAPLTLGLLAVAVILAVLLYRLEKRAPEPFLEPALLASKGMGVILALSFLQGLTMYSTLFFLSLYAQTNPSIMASPSQAGALLTPGALVQVLAAPLVGKFIPRVGYRFMVAAGTILTAGSLLSMLGGPTSLVILAVILSLSRIGGTMASVPLTAAGLEVNVQKAGSISGFRQLSNVLGGVVGPVALSAIISPRQGGLGLNFAFVLVGLLLLLALPATRYLPIRETDATTIPSRGTTRGSE